MNDDSQQLSSRQRQRDATVDRLRRELRRLVQDSNTTQRTVEEVNGFTRGYLSQVLHGHVTLTTRHVFGILVALEIPPGSFFRRFFADRRGTSEASLSEIRQRMARYDEAFKQLEEKGVLSTSPPSPAEE